MRVIFFTFLKLLLKIFVSAFYLLLNICCAVLFLSLLYHHRLDDIICDTLTESMQIHNIVWYILLQLLHRVELNSGRNQQPFQPPCLAMKNKDWRGHSLVRIGLQFLS